MLPLGYAGGYRLCRECAENGVDVARVDVELLGQLIHSDQDDCHP
jgi:hypothetical protein